MEEFKTKQMIQLKTPYTHIERAIPITGTLQIEIASWQTYKDAIVYQIEDFIIDENGAKRLINTRQKRVENVEVNQLAQAVELYGNFDGLSKVDAEWAKAKIGLLLFVQTDLVDTEKTIYGQLPNDWELCSD
jgi:hypothetical protein